MKNMRTGESTMVSPEMADFGLGCPLGDGWLEPAAPATV